jgi:hypothetical protein
MCIARIGRIFLAVEEFTERMQFHIAAGRGPCSFCGREDWKVKFGRPSTRTAAERYETGLTEEERLGICERRVAGFFRLCELDLGDDWYREALADNET